MELKAEKILISPLCKRIRFIEKNGLFFDIDYAQFINSAYQDRNKLKMGYKSHTFIADMSVRLPHVKAMIYNTMLCTNEDIEAMKCGRIIISTVDDIAFRRLVEFSKAEMDTVIAVLTNCYSQQNVIEYCQFRGFKVQSLNNPSNNGVVVTFMTTLDKRSVGKNLKYCTERVLKSINVSLTSMRIMSNKDSYVAYMGVKRD